MLDDEKDLLIKKKLQQDKTISSKANDIFKNFEKEYLTSDENKSKSTEDKDTKSNDNVIELKTHSFLRKIRNFTAVAASFLVAISVGTGVAIYSNVNGNKGNTDYTTINIDNGSTASDYTVAEVKNEEVKVEENVEKRVHENNLIKAVLTTDGNVAIQLKKDFLDYHKLKVDTTKMYKVSNITGNIKDIFVCSMVSKEIPYVLLLMEDGTVEVIQILNEETTGTKEYKFNFYDQGKIAGLKNVEKLEEKTEPLVDSEKDFYYVNAIMKDGSKKQIESLERVSMNDISTNRVTFNSQDSEKKYTIYAEDDMYVQAFGWSGASNNVYYINDNCLYHKSLVDGTETKLVTGAKSIKIDDDGTIIVKLKFTNFIHRNDQYIKLEQYNVTDSKIIDQKEDDNMIVCLKSDGSITVELKKGSKKKVEAVEYFKENYIYNFYAGSYSVHVYNEYSNYDPSKQGSNYYSNATAIYLDEIGTKGKKYLALTTKDGESVVVDIYEYIKTSTSGTFEGQPGDNKYVVLRGKYDKRVEKMESCDLKVKFEDGSIKDCKSIEVIYIDGKKTIIPVTTLLNKEGYTNFTIVND